MRTASQTLDSSEPVRSGHAITHSPEESRQSLVTSSSQASGSLPSPIINPMRHSRNQDSSFDGTGPNQDVVGALMQKVNNRKTIQALSNVHAEPFRPTRSGSEVGSNYTEEAIYDPDQTPRRPARGGMTNADRLDSDYSTATLKTVPPPIVTQNIDRQTPQDRLQPNSGGGVISGIRRPPLLQVSQSHLPGYPANNDSSDGDLSSVVTDVAPTRRPNFEAMERNSRNNVGSKITPSSSHDTVSRMRNKILAKELWMRDENAKDCFYCGDTFSAFRRKHHCRE